MKVKKFITFRIKKIRKVFRIHDIITWILMIIQIYCMIK